VTSSDLPALQSWLLDSRHAPDSGMTLMQGLVEDYLRAFESALETRASEVSETPLAAYVRLSADECEEPQPSASWIFSAIAEDPDFLTPIKSFKRQLLERLKGETNDLKSLLICFAAIEGLRSMNLFDADVLSPDERQLLVASLLEIADPGQAPATGSK